MTSHATISPQEAADRLAIRELIDAYAHCADRRDATGQMALFTADTRFLVFMDATAADNLNSYAATMHFNGQSTVFLDGTGRPVRATNLDEFVTQDGQWLFAERRLMVNWTETRPSVA